MSVAVPMGDVLAVGVAPLAAVGETVARTVLSGSMLLAVPLALLAGLISFASPCVLPLVPGYLGYVTGMAGVPASPRRAPGRSSGGRADGATAPAPDGAGAGADAPPAGRPAGGAVVAPARPDLRDVARGRMVAGVGLFVAGFTAVFVTFGVLAGSVGAALAQWSDPVTRVLGVVVVVMGLAFLGRIPFLQRERRLHLAPAAGLWGAPLLGVVFGLGWAPCIGPTLMAVYTLALDGGTAARGAVLSVAYCAGLGLPFLLIALGFDRSARALGFLRRHRVALTRTGGIVLVAVGLALVTGVWGAWTQSLQGWVAGFRTIV